MENNTQSYAYYDGLFIYLFDKGEKVSTVGYNHEHPFNVPTEDILATGTIEELVAFKKTHK